MGVLFFIFACIAILAIISLHISLTIGSREQFDTIVRVFLLVIIIHIIHAFLVRLAPVEYFYIDRAAPFGLLYGPLAYFGYATSAGHILKRKTILRHISLFLIGILSYALFLASDYIRSFDMIYYSFLYGLMALSWLGYSSWITYQSLSRKAHPILRNGDLLTIVMIILFTLSMYIILVVATRTLKGIPAQSIMSSLMIFTSMLGVVLSVYLFMIRRFKEEIHSLAADRRKFGDKNDGDSTSYLKSGIQADDIEEYVRKINDYLSSKRYLDPSFSLKVMSSELKIPRHHLSQVFNQYFGQNFLKYVNSLRIIYACELLESLDKNSNIEDLAEQCGFNSKTSFYRNFREIAEMTPSEFLNRSSKEKIT